MIKPNLLFIAPVMSRSGYGEHARDIVRALIKLDKYDVKILPIRWGMTPLNALKEGIDNDLLSRIMNNPQLPKKPELCIQLTVPNEFQPIGEFNIGITAGIETNLCSAQWLEGLNRMNFTIVPSNFSKMVFEGTVFTQQDNNTKQIVSQLKCNKPIHVLFEGANTSIYYKTENIPTKIRKELNNISEDFAFLFVGHWLNGQLGADRKDVGMLVKTFLETFKNRKKKPALLLKTGNTFSYMDRLELTSKITDIKKSMVGDLPNIYIIFGELTPEEMNGLYNHSKVKAHISFTKGEGFGRPLLEASLSEKPVMVSGWSGHVDFLPKELAILLPGEIREVHPSAVWNGVIEAQSKWFNINYSFASNIMLDVFNRYENYLPNAKVLSEKNKKEFNFDKMVEQLDKILTDNVPKFAVKAEIKLPKLPKLKPIGKKIENQNLNEALKIMKETGSMKMDDSLREIVKQEDIQKEEKNNAEEISEKT